jgi:hypothetical protein
MTDQTTKPPRRKSPGRPPKPGPHMERKAITLYPEEWAQLDDIHGKNRSEKIRYLIEFFLLH